MEEIKPYQSNQTFGSHFCFFPPIFYFILQYLGEAGMSWHTPATIKRLH